MRSILDRESGHLVLDAAGTPATFFSEGSISLEASEKTVPLPSSMFGKLDDIPVGRMAKLKFIPQEFSTGAAGRLFPFGAMYLGQSIFGSSDVTMDIHTVSGKRIRMACVAVHEEPGIRGSIEKTVFDAVEFYGILPIGGNPNALASFINETSVSYPGASAFDQTKAITPAWTTAWGASPFDAIMLSKEGFTLKSKAEFNEDEVNGQGVLDMALKSYDLEASFTPMNATRAQVMARMGWDVPLGGRKSAGKADFIASGTGIYIAARNMVWNNSEAFQFDSDKRTVGKMTLGSTKTITAGVRGEMLYISDAAPEES